MLTILPVNSRNVKRLPGFQTLFLKLGPQREHRLLVSCARDCLEESQAFAEELKRTFGDVTVYMVGNVETNIPGRTQHLRDTLLYLAESGNRDPWIWLEYACPTNPRWLDQIQEEWRTKPNDRHFLGCIEDTYFKATPAEQLRTGSEKTLFKRKGRHVRFGVYPADFLARVPLFHSANAIPWEMHCQNEIVGFCHPSATMVTLWASSDFQSSGNSYVEGKQTPGVESEIRKNGRVRCDMTELALVHGCRDGSLEFIVSRRKHAIMSRKAEVRLEAVKENAGEMREYIKELETRIQELVEELTLIKVDFYQATGDYWKTTLLPEKEETPPPLQTLAEFDDEDSEIEEEEEEPRDMPELIPTPEDDTPADEEGEAEEEPEEEEETPAPAKRQFAKLEDL